MVIQPQDVRFLHGEAPACAFSPGGLVTHRMDSSGHPNGPLPPVILTPGPTRSRPRWWIHFALIACYPVVVGLLSSERVAGAPAALGNTVAGLLTVLAGELLIFGTVFGAAWLASRASRQDLLLPWRPGWQVIPLGIGYSLGLRLMLAVIMGAAVALLLGVGATTPAAFQDFMMRNRPDIESVIDVQALSNEPVYFWLSLTLVSFVLGGLREELWRSAFLAGTRTLWPSLFSSPRGQLAAAGLASLAFGLGHLGQGWLAVLLTGLLGMGLGAIMVLHRSIWPAVVAHGLFNATSLALIPWVLDKLPR